jgi:uncharacterized membrane protein YozB (DUF420 family)
MKKDNTILTRTIILISLVSGVIESIQAQQPTHYPTTNTDPMEFNFINILIFIVFPVVLIAGFIIIRRRRRKRK